ncbi:MAG TPA: glycosyltransferase [Candidatus Angelobacter sp.]|nr:glycosyltransferase [Candidatus Angelobacter sp.]
MKDSQKAGYQRKTKIVRIIARLNVGGAARQVCALHQELAPCFATRIITGRLASGEQDMSYLLPSEENVYRLPQMSREVSVWDDAVAFWQIWKILRRERPEIVHTHTAKAGVLGRAAAWLAGVPVIVHTYHGHVFHGYFSPAKTKMFIAVERMMARLSSRIIAVSESQKQELALKYRIAPPEKFSVVHNGFDLERFTQNSRASARKKLGLVPDELAVVWAGRIVPVKDVELLGQVIRAASAVSEKIRFLVVGDGEDKPKLVSMTKECVNVSFLGHQNDMGPIWAAADLALLTSRNEGTPTALIEGMAAGLPFVSTDVGGVRDLAVGPLLELPDAPGWRAANGFLTPRTPGALLRCIQEIARTREMAREMGAVGRAFSLKKFSLHRQVEEISLLYNYLLGERPPEPQACKEAFSQPKKIV